MNILSKTDTDKNWKVNDYKEIKYQCLMNFRSVSWNCVRGHMSQKLVEEKYLLEMENHLRLSAGIEWNKENQHEDKKEGDGWIHIKEENGFWWLLQLFSEVNKCF